MMLFALACILALRYTKRGIFKRHPHALYKQYPHVGPYNIGSAYGIFKTVRGSLYISHPQVKATG